MNQTTTIQTRDLDKNFGQVKALKGVNLEIDHGQIFGLLGANGAGKTTLIRLLIGSTKPSSGRLSVLGFDPTKQKRAVRKLIGYMPQSAALYEDLYSAAGLFTAKGNPANGRWFVTYNKSMPAKQEKSANWINQDRHQK